MPNLPQGFLKKAEITSANCYYSELFTAEERVEFDPKLDRIFNTFGYRVNLRSGASSGLRMYILSHSNRPIEDLYDMSRIPHEELVQYMRDFTAMMDDTTRSPEEIGRDFGLMQKNAMQRLKSIRIPDFRNNGLDDLVQYHKMINFMRIITIDYSQDMQNFLGGTTELDTKVKDKYFNARKAFFEAYSEQEREKDEAKLGSFANSFAVAYSFILENYELGRLGTACAALYRFREFIQRFAGQTIGELPAGLAVAERNYMNQLIAMQFPGNSDDAYTRYLEGKTGKFPGMEGIPDFINGCEAVGLTSFNQDPDALADRFGKTAFGTAVSVLPQELPDNLLELPEDVKNQLDFVFRNTFGKLYYHSEAYPIYDAGKDIYDLLKVTVDGNEKSIRELTGEKYANLTEPERMGAMKYEVFRLLREHPEGLKVYTYHYGPGMIPQPVEQPVTVKQMPETIRFDFAIDAKNTATVDQAMEFLAVPENGVPTGISEMATRIYEILDKQMSVSDMVLNQHGMDIFDCIYVGDQTVNEMIAEKYSQMSAIQKGYNGHGELYKAKAAVLAAQIFNPAKPVFVAMPFVKAEGTIGKSTVIPLTFSGTGVEFTQGMERINRIAQTKQEGERILRQREEFYQNKEKAYDSLFKRADRIVKDRVVNYTIGEFEERMAKIRLYSTVAMPDSNVFLERVSAKLEELSDEVHTIGAKIDTLRLAANLSEDEEIRNRLTEEVNQLTANPPISDYDNYITGLEYYYGIRAIPENDSFFRDNGKLETFFEEKMGINLPIFPASGEFHQKYRFYRPTEIELPFSKNATHNEQVSEDLIRAVYQTAGLGLTDHEEEQYQHFGRYILINGRPVEEMIGFTLLPGNINSYIQRIADKVKTALSQGKPVDFYVRADRNGSAVLSSVPIRIKALGDTVTIPGANERNTNEERQRQAHNALMGAYQHEDEQIDRIRAKEERIRQTKEIRFEELLRASENKTSDLTHFNAVSNMLAKYYPAGKPVSVSRSIRTSRGTPVNYIIMRLCEESEALIRQGKPGYTIDQIISCNALEEQKRRYAAEFLEICQKGDLTAYNKNMVNGAQAAYRLFNKEYDLRTIATNQEEFEKAYTGKPGYILAALFDVYQELNLPENKSIQERDKLFDSNQARESFFDDIAAHVNIVNGVATANDYLRYSSLELKAKRLDDMHFLAGVAGKQWARQTVLANIALGNTRIINDAERITNQIGEEIDDLAAVPAVREFLQRNDLAQILIQHKVDDYLFIDFDSYMAAKESGEPYDAASFVTALNPAHPEQRAALEKEALEKRLARMDKPELEKRLQEKFAQSRRLFYPEIQGEPERILGTEPKKIEDMSPEERNQAVSLFDSLFGPIINRENYREYVRSHQGMDVLDFVCINDVPAGRFLGIQKAEGVSYSPEQINQIKAEYVRLSTIPGYHMSYRPLLRNAQGQPEIGKNEEFFNPEWKERVIKQYPYMQSVTTYKSYMVNQAAILNFDRLSDDALQTQYEMTLRQMAGNLNTEERITSLEDLKKSVDAANPQNYNFAKIQTVFGARPSLVTDWVQTTAGVYNKYQLDNNLPDFEKGSFTEEEFATLSLLASIDFNHVKLDDSLIHEDDQGFDPALRRAVLRNTRAFLGDNPGNLGIRALNETVNPARKAASEAIQKAEQQGEGKDIEPLQNIILRGIGTAMVMAKEEPSILNAGGEFTFFLSVLKKADALLQKNDELRQAVETALTDQEKKEFHSLVNLEELFERKQIALENLNQHQVGKMELNQEQLSGYLLDVSIYNSLAERWGAAQHPGQIPDAIQNDLQDEEHIQNLRDAQKTLSVQLTVIHNYAKEQLRIFREAKAIQSQDARGKYIIDEATEAKRSKDLTESEYRYMAFKESLCNALTDEMVRLAKVSYDRKHPNNPVGITNVEQLKDSVISDQRNAELQGAFLEELFFELSKALYAVPKLKDSVEKIKTPVEQLTLDPDKLVRHNYHDRIETLKNNVAPGQQHDDTIAMLEELDCSLTVTNSETRAFFHKYDNLNERSKVFTKPYEEQIDTLNDGRYSNIITEEIGVREDNNMMNSGSRYVNPAKEADIVALREHPTIPSEGVRRKIAKIIHAMDEAGMFPQNGNVQVEQGQKVYGYYALTNAYNELTAAIEGNDLARIQSCKEQYDRQRENMRGIYALIKASFPNAKSAPGNIDCMRTAFIPLEFTKEGHWESLMNGIFLLGSQARRANMPIENFLSNPVRGTETIVDQRINDNKMENRLARYDNAFDSFYHLYKESQGGEPDPNNPLNSIPDLDSISMDRQLYGGPITAGIALGRPLDVLYFLEEDENIRKNMIADYKVTEKFMGTKVENESAVNKFIGKLAIPGQVPDQTFQLFTQGLKAAILENSPLKRKHLPIHSMNANGVKNENNFDYQESLSVRDRYASLADSYRKNLAVVRKDRLVIPTMKNLLEETLFDYLKAHPEDMNRREYKNLERIALGAGKQMGIQTSQAADYLQFKENFRQKVTELQNAVKLKEDEFHKRLDTIKKEYDEASRQSGRNPQNANVQRQVSNIITKFDMAINQHLIELENDYRMKKISQNYLQKRYLQLSEMKGDPARYRNHRIPDFFGGAGELRAKDARMVVDKLSGREWSGRLKNLESFKKWKLKEDEAREILYEDELSEEDWQNAYENELAKYGAEHVHLPQGLLTEAELARQIDEHQAGLQHRLAGDELIANMNDVGQAAAEQQVVGNDMQIINHVQALNAEIRGNFATYLKTAGVPDPNDVNRQDPYKQQIYNDVATILAEKLSSDRGGRIPGGIAAFANRIAGDNDFKMVMMPILDRVRSEYNDIQQRALNNPDLNVADVERPWAGKLVQIINQRTILNAYGIQKKAMAANPQALDGLNMMNKVVDQMGKEIAAAHAPVQAAGNQHQHAAIAPHH